MLKPIGIASRLIAIAVLSTALSACEKRDVEAEGPAEMLGQQIDKAAARAGEHLNKAGEKVGQGLQEVGKRLQQEAEEAQKNE